MREVREATTEIRNQRGAGLVVAMLVLLFITLLAATLMQGITIEDRITGENLRDSNALNVAESGIAEATERIRQGEIPDDGNPLMVAQIFLTSPGTVPVCGTDTVALATWQSAPWLDYSAASKSPEVLTVRYKTDAARTKIFRYDANLNPRIQTVSGEPIFVITSTGRVGTATRTVMTEVIRAPITVTAIAAVAGKTSVQSLHEVYLCGYDHDPATPAWISSTNGRDKQMGACNENLAIDHWELPGNSLPGVWTGGKFNSNKKGTEDGTPKVWENRTGFPAPWTMLNLSQGDFATVVGTPFTQDVAASLYGVRYYKPASGTLSINGGDGDGMIYVEGSVQIKGTFTYRGLIYATGGIDVYAHAWVLGSMVAGGKLRCFGHRNSITVLYSRKALDQNLSRYSGRFVTLAWREVQNTSTPGPGTPGS